jgi:hypothetical protein
MYLEVLAGFDAALKSESKHELKKPKLHLLAHVPDHIRRFGPLLFSSTEAFESFNSKIRHEVVTSNGSNTSEHLARRFATYYWLEGIDTSGFLNKDIPLAEIWESQRSTDKRSNTSSIRWSSFCRDGVFVVVKVILYSALVSSK